MALSFRAHQTAPHSVFLKWWFPALLSPLALNLFRIPILVWRISRPDYNGPWP